MVYQRPGPPRIDQSCGSAKTGGSESYLSNGVFIFSHQCYSSRFSVGLEHRFLSVKEYDCFLVHFLSHTMNTYFIITNILLMILHGRRVLYEMLFGLFLARLLVGVGLDGGVFYYRPPGTVHGGVICCTVSNVVVFLFMSGYDLLRMFFLFFSPYSSRR